MPKILDACQKFFGTRDVYELFGVTKDAQPKDIKKAYYKLSLKVHPDRVPEAEKAQATEKFKILSKLHEVLSDQSRKSVYDERGVIDDDDEDYESRLMNWLEVWKTMFKPISTEDIGNYQREYVGSELERTDIKKAYLSGKGCINNMFNEVPFIQVEDEPRLQEIVRKMIDSGEVPEYTIFTREHPQKRLRRHKKYERESREADAIKRKMQAKSDLSLEQQIMKRHQDRSSDFGSLITRLANKYCNEDKTDAVDFNALDRKQKKKKKNSANHNNMRNVKNGKVQKRGA